MKILLAGPGTGKTTNIKDIIIEQGGGSKFLILSFTNATVSDLLLNLSDNDISEKNCMTLHKFAVKYNHDNKRHVLLQKEVEVLKNVSKGTKIDFRSLCDFLRCTTFDQMVERFVEYANVNPLYLQQKLTKYDSLVIDEYQDFNPSEQKLIDILIRNIETVYLLGDDDQCIYDFKDASSDKIISFYNDPSNEIITHEHKCYRCPDEVVEHATILIKNNKHRVDKEWKKTGVPGTISHTQLESFEDVAANIVERVKLLVDEDVLILTPVEFSAEPLFTKFDEYNIQYTNYFKKRIPDELIFKTWEVRSIFGDYKYLNLLLVGYGVLNDRKKFYKLLKTHFDKGISYEQLYDLLIKRLPDQMKDSKNSLVDFLNQSNYLGILSLYGASQGQEQQEKLENIFKELPVEDVKKVKIMSIHKSKGLGADYVFMIGLNEGIIPNKKSGNDTIESQRRLFYVGITRTKKQLYLYSNIQIEGRYVNKVNKEDFMYNYLSKKYDGKTSSFVSELKL